MKFRGHETFFIRKGWLYKGIKGVGNNPAVFIDKEENPMDVLGMGSNMVKSLRYWMQATRLTTEPDARGKKRTQTKTAFGELVEQYDPHMEEEGTLWLLHYMLATNKQLATSWYYFFNVFRMFEFQREDFVKGISNYALMEGEVPAESSLEDDFNCIVNMYVERKKINPSRVNPESNIESPLQNLGLIDIANSRERSFKKTIPERGRIPSYVLLAAILEQNPGKKEIKIQDLQNKPGNIGCVFNLDIAALTWELDRLSKLGLIQVIRTAGLDLIKINKDYDFDQCVKMYYSSLV